MQPPKLEKLNTKNGEIWRIYYAGMIKEHRQEWQARVFYEQALRLYTQRLTRVF